MQDERTKRLLEARKKLLKRMGYSETTIGLKDIKESVDKLIDLLSSKKVVEKKVLRETRLLDGTKQIADKLDTLINSSKETKVKNLKDIPLTEEVKITNFEELEKHIKRPIVKIKQTKVEFPKRQKVYVDNFPNQIANKTEIEKDDWGRPTRIYEEYDNFALEFSFERDNKNTTIQVIKTKV